MWRWVIGGESPACHMSRCVIVMCHTYVIVMCVICHKRLALSHITQGHITQIMMCVMCHTCDSDLCDMSLSHMTRLESLVITHTLACVMQHMSWSVTCYITHTILRHVSHDSPPPLCDMTCRIVSRDSLVCVTWLMRTGAKKSKYSWHDDSFCVRRWDDESFCVRRCHDESSCHDMTTPFVLDDSCKRVAWLVKMCDRAHLMLHDTPHFILHMSMCLCVLVSSCGWACLLYITNTNTHVPPPSPTHIHAPPALRKRQSSHYWGRPCMYVSGWVGG